MQTAIAPMTVKDRITKHWDSFGSHCIYASRGLKPNEANYAPTKLECLAVIWAVKLFRPYLLGKKFMIITDHSALTGLLKTPNPTGIIARWIVTLSEYDFDIKYRPGRVNESADFLSRLGY